MNGTRPIRGAALFLSLLFIASFSGARAEGIAEQIQASEYQVSWDTEKAAYQAPNRAHGFRTYFQAQGIVAVPREEAEPSWQWGLTWIAYGRGEASWPVPAANVESSGGRVDYQRGKLLEWYENTPAGLKQNFVLASPPEELLGGVAGDRRARGLLHLDLALTGELSAVVSEDHQAIDFVTGDGTRVLRYTALKVTDARGSVVPSRMEAFVRGDVRIVRLLLDASDATFPLTVDPLTLSPVWTFESDQASAALGQSVATAGDFNGDGYSDILVGAPFYDNGEVNEGAVFFFRGSPSGPQAAGFYEGNQGGALAGSGVAAAGDVNGDGYGDVIVGVSGYDNPENSEGRAYLLLGSAAGISLTPAWTWESNIVGTSCGSSVGGAGDVNGDGYGDVVVGCNAGARAYFFLGSASGLAASPTQTYTGAAGSTLGNTVGTAGDVNGDGYADVLVTGYGYANGQTAEGIAYVYHGSASGPPPSPSWAYESDHAGTNMISAGTAGDVNGDGYADIVLGGSLYGAVGDEGRAFFFYGSATGLPPAPSLFIDGVQNIGHYGNSVSSAGDIDGDGYADVLVAQEQYNNGQSSEGRAYLYRGGPAGLVTTPAWTYETNQMGFGTQMTVATAGDINGDGYGDVLLGFRFYANGQTGEGRAMLFMGSPRATSPQAAYTNESNQAGADFGTGMDTADVNGDGYADLLVGATYYDAGQTDEGRVYAYLGSASGIPAAPDWMTESDQADAYLGGVRGVANAGDVNGDGYDDVVLGAAWYDAAFVNGGRALLLHGSPTGLSPSPAWSVSGGQANAFLGFAVSTAGDVNGDGYADVIVGAHGAGNAFVYHGSASGLSPTPSWTASAHTGDVQFGLIVATAGDVNGDGFSDVLVSAPDVSVGDPPHPSGPDRVYLYLGSPSGLSLTHSWMIEGPSGAGLGVAIGTAGDVNGDGFADVFVGSPFAGPAQQGRVQVYHGSATGLSIVPAWTVQSGAGTTFFYLGYSARTAGDVNGDGYADLLVGAPSSGHAYVYLGSATGLALIQAWPPPGFPPSGVFYGAAVAAGDVNGDGYADLVVGAPYDSAGQTEEGFAYLYYGSGLGRSVTPRQRAADGSRPIAYQGATEEPSFRLGVLSARLPFGRGRVRLYAEVKPFGTPFDGSPTVVGGGDSGTAGVPIEFPVEFLAPGTRYHWRLRIVPDASYFPMAPASRWFTAPWRGWNEPMLRTGAGAPAGRASGLIVHKVGLGVTLNWAADSGCVSETSYEIFEGTLGNFTSHVPITCATGSGHSWNFTPQAGDRYFLIVPRNGGFEGSYGKLRDGSERPASIAACLPQLIGCP